jgi:hypothetical protein
MKHRVFDPAQNRAAHKLPFAERKNSCFAERKAPMVVITLRVMIRHAERDGYYMTSFAERKATLSVVRDVSEACAALAARSHHKRELPPAKRARVAVNHLDGHALF